MKASEIAAAADTAATARIAAQTAKGAWDADQTNDSLKTAYDTAQKTADDAKSALDGLSQDGQSPDKKTKVEKIKRKMAYLKKDLKDLGADDDDDENDDEEIDPGEIDPNRAVTFKDLERMKIRDASKGAEDMVNAITDSIARDAVKAALRRIVPSGDPQKDFTDAVAIANREKNSKILEEIMRKPIPPQHRSGAGAPPPEPDGQFIPTAEEARMQKAFGLTEKEILAARKQEEAQRK